MKFLHKKKTQAKERKKEGLNSEFVQSLDFSVSFEDMFGDETPDETTFYNLDGTVAEVEADERK